MWFTISHREQRLSETVQFSSVEKAVTCKWVKIKLRYDNQRSRVLNFETGSTTDFELTAIFWSRKVSFEIVCFRSISWNARVSHLRLSCSDFPIVWRTHKLLGCFIFSTITKVWWPITANSKTRILMDELFYFLFYCFFFIYKSFSFIILIFTFFLVKVKVKSIEV